MRTCFLWGTSGRDVRPQPTGGLEKRLKDSSRSGLELVQNGRLESRLQKCEDCLRSLTLSEPTKVGFDQSLLRFLNARVNFKTLSKFDFIHFLGCETLEIWAFLDSFVSF